MKKKVADIVQTTPTGDPNNARKKCVAHELKFIKRLAGNDPQLSEKELKKLGKWLQLRSDSSNRA